MKENLIKELQAIVGESQVITDESTRTQKSMDLYALRLLQKHIGWKSKLPDCVVKPKNAEEISKLLKYLNENKIPVIPYGGGSGVCAGTETREDGTVVIDVSELNKIIELNVTNMTVTVEAGVYLKDLEAWLNEKGYITGHYPQSFDLAQVGGLVATRSIGQFSTKYGGIEDLVVGLEGVLADGEMVKIKPNPRRSTGPDLRHIFLGSEGMIGIMTKITLKVFPIPEKKWLQAYAVPTMKDGIECIRKVMQSDYKPAVVRLHDWIEAESPYGAHLNEGESILLFLSEGTKELCDYEGNGIDAILRAAGARALGSEPVERWFIHKNDVVAEYEEYGKLGVLADTIEISAGWEHVADIYYEACERIANEVPEVGQFSGHSSHSYWTGTNIYFMMGAVPKKDVAEAERVYDKIWSIVMETSLKHGGSICHHHGIGKHRAKWLPQELESSYVMMEKIKDVFDPNGVMNPGVIIKK